jgi:hypothetical protein
MAASERVKDKKDNSRVNPGDVYNYLTKDKGISHNHALGMLANINTESIGFQHSIVGDNGNAIGLFQHNGPRKTALLKYVNGDTTNWKKQIDFALSEQGTSKYLNKSFTTPEAATEDFMVNWERPADQSRTAIAGRQHFLTTFGNGSYATPNYQVQNNGGDISSDQSIPYSSAPQFLTSSPSNYSQQANNFKTDIAVEKEKVKKVESDPATKELTAVEKEHNARINFLNMYNTKEEPAAENPLVNTTAEPIEKDPSLYRQDIPFELNDQTTPLFKTSLDLPEPSMPVQEFAEGGTVSEIWEQQTGTPWSEAKKSGRTTGTLESNLQLRQELISKSQPTTLPSTTTISTAPPKTFNEAFKVARDTLGANNIFEYKGRKFGTNLPGELFNPADEVLKDANLNTPQVKKRLKEQNDLVDSPYATKKTTKLQPDDYLPWDKVKQRTEELNKKSNADLIIDWNKKNKPANNYVIIDKTKGLLHIYSPEGNLLTSSAVDTGKNAGDAQTVTKYKDINNDGKITDADKVGGKNKVDWSAGNMSTGAGKYYISNIDKKGYEDLPILNMMNESQYKQYKKTGKVENVATSFHKGYIKDDESRVSNGCIRCNKSTLDNLSNMLSNSSEVYILPDDKGNQFVVENGQLNFKTKAKVDYNTYTDSKNKTQKGQGINSTTNTLKHIPIKVKLDAQKFRSEKFTYLDIDDEKELENVKKYTLALQNNKQQIMKAAKINGDVYNEIAKMAFGIFGTESNYADTHSFEGNAARAAVKLFNPSGSSSPDYQTKYSLYGAKGDNRSVGLTQVRWKYLNTDEKAALKKLGIKTNEDFLDPKKAAIGTATILGIRYNQQLTEKDKKDIWKNLPKKWNVRENYPDRVKENSKYIQIYQKNTSFRDGGTFRDGGDFEFGDGERTQSLADLTIGDEYHYAGRPEKSYKINDNGEWLIRDSGSKDNWKPIKDPTGERAATLERTVMPKSEYLEQRRMAIQKELGTIKGQGNKFYLPDTRTMRATTGQAIRPNVDLMGGDYSEDVVKEIIIKARAKGVDPKTALAIALQESQLGKKDTNLGHSLVGSDDPYSYMDVLKSKVGLAKTKGHEDEITQLQFYNGTGKLFPGTEAKYHGFQSGKFYGVPVTAEGLDMLENPLYGKQIVDLRDNVIGKSKHIDSLLNVKSFAEGGEYQSNEYPDGGLHVNPWLYTYNQENMNSDIGQVIGGGADFQHRSGLHGSANVELPFFNRNAEGMSTQSLGFEKGYKNFSGDVTLRNESYPGAKFNPSATASINYQKDLGDNYSFNAGVSNSFFPENYKNLNFQAGIKYHFAEGGKQDDGLYAHSGHNYKKIDGKWYMEPNKNSGNYKLIEQGDVKSRINELEKNAQVRSEELDRQIAWKEFGKTLNIPRQKIPTSMGEAQQMMDRGELDYESWDERKARNQREADDRKNQRIKSLTDYEKRYNNPNYNQFTGIPGESYRDNLAKEAESLDAKFRVSQEDNFFDDYINPAVWVGSMAKALGEAPKKAKETDSYMPYVSSIGAPLLGGALGSLEMSSNKQFISNLVNPLAGTGDILKNASTKVGNQIVQEAKINSVNNVGKRLTFTEKLNPIFDHVNGVTEAISDPFRYALTSSQKNKLVKGQDDAFEKAINFIEEWNFNPDGTINNSVKQRMKDLTEYVRTKEALDSYNRYDNSIYNPMTKPNKLVSARRKDLELSDITDSDKTYITKNRADINGVNTSDASITLRNAGNYYKKPENIAGTVVHESAHSTQALGQKHSAEDGWSKPWSEGTTKFDKNYGYFTSNKETEVGREFAKHMVEPTLISPGSSHSYKTWKSSPDELHSDLMTSRYKVVEKLSKNQTKEFRDDLINRLRDNPTDADIDLLLKNDLHKFFKSSTSQKNKRKLIRMLPAIIPAVGVGANQQQYREGGVSGAMILDSLLDQNNINEFKQKYGL